jgi:hypothetical protein
MRARGAEVAEEDIPYVVCVGAEVKDTTFGATNVRGVCSRCHRIVQHRPHVPTPNRLICIPCLPVFQAEMAARGETITYAVTPQTVLELDQYFRRN